MYIVVVCKVYTLSFKRCNILISLVLAGRFTANTFFPRLHTKTEGYKYYRQRDISIDIGQREVL